MWALRAIGATMVAALLPAGNVVPQSAYRIEKITIQRNPIFDAESPSEGKFIGTLVNSLHWLTRESVIRNELLFEEGDQLDIEAVHETERNLRGLGIIGDIATRIDTLDDSTVAITIETRDKMTLGANPSYQRGGGVQSFSFTAKDDNFWGNAQSVSVGYNYRSDRSSPHGVEVIFSDRRLFGSRWGTKLQYKDSEELSMQSLQLDRGFYADAARWAGGFSFDRTEVRIPFYEGGIKIRENLISQQLHKAYYALSFGDEIKLRPAVVGFHSRAHGGNQRTWDNLDIVNIGLNIMRRRYYERVFLNNHGRIEDVPIGFLANFVAGRNLRLSGTDGPAYYFQANWVHSVNIDAAYYLGYSISYNTFAGATGFRESTFGWSFLQYFKWKYDQVFVARVSGTHGIDWSPDRQLYLGNATGLRGYNNFELGGQRRIQCNIEHRFFSRAKIWIFRIGGAAFWDGGTVWSGDQNLWREKFHNALGAGLRIENTKQQGSGVIRIDLAYNFDRRAIGEVIISSSVPLSAFQELGFILPNISDQ